MILALCISFPEKVFQVLDQVTKDDQNANVIVETDENGNLTLIFIQLGSHKTFLDRYPELLMLDTTYKTNNRAFPLCTVMGIDGNGNGQVVAHGFVVNDVKETWKSLLELLKRHNPAMERTTVFLVDKDFREISGIKAVFPDTQVHLCLFHVRQAINRHLQPKTKEREEVNQLISRMIRSTSEDEYDMAYNVLQQAASKFCSVSTLFVG